MTDCAETDSSDCVVGACDSENVKPSSSDAMNDVGLTLSVSVSASCEPSSLNTNTAVPCCALLSVTPSAVNVYVTLADAHDAANARPTAARTLGMLIVFTIVISCVCKRW